jgi:hypothetical protein
MRYSKKFRIRTMDSFIAGYRSTKKEAIALALQQAERLKESISVEMRNADGEYGQVCIALNFSGFSTIDERR